MLSFYVKLIIKEMLLLRNFSPIISEKRTISLSTLDLESLAESTEGFSEVRIESVIKEGIENGFLEGGFEVTKEDIFKSIENNYSRRKCIKKGI